MHQALGQFTHVNPLTALSGLSVPLTLREPGYRRVWAGAEALREGATVLSSSVQTAKRQPDADNRYMADGANTWLVTIILGRLVPWALTALPNVIFQCCLPDRPYYSSMWQDLYEGRSVTEIDDLSGIIVQLAELQQMMPVPVNQALTRLVKEAQGRW